MIRVARFDVDPTERRAVQHLVRYAFTPRSTREAVVLRACLALDRRGVAVRPQRLAPPAPAVAGAPSHDAALAASAEALGLDVTSGLSLTHAVHAMGARRLLFLWRAREAEPLAVAKVAPAGGAVALAREAAGLQRVGQLGEDLAAGCPRLLSHGVGRGLAVLVEECVAGESLARLHRLRLRPGSWHPAHFAAAGHWLGRFHAETARAAGESGARVACTAVHGDAWSRNVIVRPGGGDGPLRLLSFLDWESFGEEGDPLSDALSFVVESAKADLAGRGRPARSRLSAHAELVRWLFVRGSRPHPAVRAFFSTWREALSRALDTSWVREAAVARLAAGAESGRLPQRLVDALLSPSSALA